jgi:ADP-ribosyl-[dinitrogen reductase] hydrolase
MPSPDYRTRVRGCLLGGAVGDALGAPIEFMSAEAIARRFEFPLTDILPPGRFTDDTQMVLFTCEGLIRANVRGRSKGICHPPSVVYYAYLRWLHTQGRVVDKELLNGWLVRERRLHRQQMPGITCLSALESGEIGTTAEPINDSKGCGGVMRAAPVGLVRWASEDTYQLGCDIAALTHGHPLGWQSAGVLAVIIRSLVDGEPLQRAVDAAMREADDEMLGVMEHALAVAEAGVPDATTIERELGAGWVGEEALAIAVACALAAPDFASGVIAAVNHSGDSDSTGSICGNILGALHGETAIPTEWLDALHARDLIEIVADDFVREMIDPPIEDPNGYDDPPRWWWERYPGG